LPWRTAGFYSPPRHQPHHPSEAQVPSFQNALPAVLAPQGAREKLSRHKLPRVGFADRIAS
jgi:hypothetical protein